MSILLATHVGGAAIGLFTGAAALSLKKGSVRHRMSGRIFVVSMLIMAATAAPLAYAADKLMDVFSGMLVCYLVLTAWMTVRNRNAALDLGLMALGLLTLVGYLWVEWEAVQSGERRADVPVGAGYIFAGLIFMALIGDGRQILNGSVVGSKKIARHLWRMCFALFMATVSFFLSRAHLFPDVVRATGVLYVLALAPLVLMLFWWIYTRFTKRPVGVAS